MNSNYNHRNILYIMLLFCLIFGLKINADEDTHKEIKWEIIKSNNLKDNKESVNWEIIQKDKGIKIKDNTKNKLKIKNRLKNSNNSLLQLGKSVPTANTLSKGDLRLETSHVSTINGGISGGIGNQNYSGTIEYGLSDKLTINIFYTEADDPLYKKINGLEKQPENLWSNYGINMKWKIIEDNNYNISIDSAIERWRVGSGGCYGYNCINESNNIFNSGKQKVLNDNYIISISAPITWNWLAKYNFTIVPRITNLPKYQSNSNGSGKYYGNNTGIGIGGSYKFNNKTTTFISSYFPIDSKNSFDKDLKFKKKQIYTTGLNYELDERISLEGYITNSFGQTPATSILTIPSSNELLYGGRLIYTPTNNRFLENGEKIINEDIRPLGYSVNTTDLVLKGKNKIDNSITNKSYNIKKIFGFSENFNLDFSLEKLNSDSGKNSHYKKKYMKKDSFIIRGGGKAILFKEERGDLISSGFRLSYGRVLAENRAGYLFSELVNTKILSKNIKLNINPKATFSSDKTLASIGTSINWKIRKYLTISPELNNSIMNSDNNYSILVTARPNNRISFETFITNSHGNTDMGQLLKADQLNYGIRSEYKF